MARHKQERTALIIDDEPGICSVIKSFLRNLGLGSITCNSAEEGLRLLDGAGADYGLVILDYRLFGMDGADCFREIRKRRTNLPVLFISAYSGQAGLEQVLQQPGTNLLSKPFSIQQFREAIAKLVPGLV
jgi:two-component system, cell cycle response regulator CpdR